MRLAGLVEAAMSQAEGMQTKPGHFSSGSSVLRRKRCRIAPRWPGSCGAGCAERAVEPIRDCSCSAACRSNVSCRAASRSGAEELESRRVRPAFCVSPASFSECLLSSMGEWRALMLVFLAASGGVAAFPSCVCRAPASLLVPGCVQMESRVAGFMWGFRAIYSAQIAVSEHLHQMWQAQRHLSHNWESVLGTGRCWKVF